MTARSVAVGGKIKVFSGGLCGSDGAVGRLRGIFNVALTSISGYP